ncbi:MAG: nuclease-related domain-containing protein [Candidatus Methanomethyliaceae archaeon]
MPCKIIHQPESAKELFRQKIKEKVAREKEAVNAKLDEELPSWLAWVLKSPLGFVFDVQRGRDNLVGRIGEARASWNFWLTLPSDWILINDVVLEPQRDEFIQVDHVLIGTAGVYLIETKAWEGAFLGRKDVWKRKSGATWVRCESPTRQNQSHWDLFGRWAKETVKISLDSKEWLFPIVLFTRASWLRAENCSMPVYNDPSALALDLRRQSKNKVLTPEQVNAIAEAIVKAVPLAQLEEADSSQSEFHAVSPEEHEEKHSAKALDNQATTSAKSSFSRHPDGQHTKKVAPRGNVSQEQGAVEKGQTKDGRRYIKVFGTKEDAEKVRADYFGRGERPSDLRQDRYKQGVWFFYLGVRPSNLRL